MERRCFDSNHRELLCEAQVIAEEMTSDFFKLNHSHWQRWRYDILTLEHLRSEEVSPHALALLAKYQGLPPDSSLNSVAFDFYRICLQDHNILRTLTSGRGLAALPLFSYILTHELVHVVRFSRFQARFEATWPEKLAEEAHVHRLTQDILAPLNFLELAPVFNFYETSWQGGWRYAHL
ncbi:MAG: hypothetical protein QME75_08745 [Deltaproteobacteria bacterium]|nr:hypothetical protein [Deltaproteobacteria bacterium]